ncbi:hypothetical protein LXT21_36615 [Myxococcus sp. K38C18041901]|uniref:hypothetical protein n=1 Tax=Myxococcus guangdongensis TaxID=2906760 RepID=UPI0020A8106E|nr:hypothetical protein [Myxococcus guangdongensis]MCP3064310.1 hypothetical protein [Myxococcus guangdongensis]
MLRHILPSSRVLLTVVLGLVVSSCAGSELDPAESWTQQDDSFFEESAQAAGPTQHNCPAGQEWDAIFGCQIMYGAACYQTRGPGYMGLEPNCFKIPSPGGPPPSTSCSSTRGSAYCGTEPACYVCPKQCASTRGTGWCGQEPNCVQCGQVCANTRGAGWCGNEPNCYTCPTYCVDSRGPGWCGTEPGCYTCTNGGGTSEGG